MSYKCLDEVINFSEGFPGLPSWQQGVLRPTTFAPYFLWLQFLHEPAAAFLVLDLKQVLPEYDFNLARRMSSLNPTAEVFAIASVPGNLLAKATVNLLAPIVLDFSSPPQGQQVVLHDSGYPLRHPLFTEDEPC